MPKAWRVKFCRIRHHAGVEVDPVGTGHCVRGNGRRGGAGLELRVPPADGRYLIEMPGTPEEETVPTPVQGEKVPMMQAMVAESDVVYLVGYIDYPAEAMQGHDAAKALEAARDAVAKGPAAERQGTDRSGQPARGIRRYRAAQGPRPRHAHRVRGRAALPDGRGHGDARRQRRTAATHDASSISFRLDPPPAK